MKTIDLHKKNKEELQKELEERRENLNKLSFKLVANKLKNVREIRKIKKDIARILTIIKNKNT